MSQTDEQESPARLWHVTVTVAGTTVEPLLVRSALSRLAEERPFIVSASYSDDSAEVTYWDEGEAMLDVASLALRLWGEHRESAGLPSWEVVGLEVVEKSVHDARSVARDPEPRRTGTLSFPV